MKAQKVGHQSSIRRAHGSVASAARVVIVQELVQRLKIYMGHRIMIYWIQLRVFWVSSGGIRSWEVQKSGLAGDVARLVMNYVN
jgi:hypothetical protein